MRCNKIYISTNILERLPLDNVKIDDLANILGQSSLIKSEKKKELRFSDFIMQKNF